MKKLLALLVLAAACGATQARNTCTHVVETAKDTRFLINLKTVKLIELKGTQIRFSLLGMTDNQFTQTFQTPEQALVAYSQLVALTNGCLAS